MKSNILVALIALLTLSSLSEKPVMALDLDRSYQVATIDSGDTVIFNMAAAFINGTHVEIPVSIATDDIVNAFDFSFRYNSSRMVFDTIMLAPAGATMLAFQYLNPNDLIVRFTSSDLIAISVGVPLAYIHFDMLSGMLLDSTDLNQLRGLLNGDACSELRIAPVPVGINENEALTADVSVFPNPVSDYLVIRSDKDLQMDIRSVTGSLLLGNQSIEGGNEFRLKVVDLAEGVYILHFREGNRTGVKKILVNH